MYHIEVATGELYEGSRMEIHVWLSVVYIYIYQVGSLQWFSGSHNTVDGTKILQISGVPINWCRISSLNSMSSSIGGG